MKKPTSAEEYHELYNSRVKYFGYGMETGMSLPCPFCCNPGFMAYKILEMEEAMKRGNTCIECNRSIKAIFTKTNTTTSFEVVQTGGPDCTDPWIPPIRRIDE